MVDLESLAWYDPADDIVKVKVRMIVMDEEGNVVKKGLIVRFSEERFRKIAEGEAYPEVHINRNDVSRLPVEHAEPEDDDARFSGLIDD